MESLGASGLGGYARFWAKYNARPGDTFFYTQIVQTHRDTNSIVLYDNGTNWWVDGGPERNKYGPYNQCPADAEGIGIVKQIDAPNSPLGQTTSHVRDSFKTYIQYQPQDSGSIPVTLGRVDWSWGFVANYSTISGV